MSHQPRRRCRTLALALVALCALLVGACGEDVETVSPDVCASEKRWIGGNSESPLMNPGEACIDCHSRDDGPTFAAAGTVYGAPAQSNDCFGRRALTVTVVGAIGQEVSTTTNEAGNFWFEPSSFANIELPYTARVTDGTTTAEMTVPVMDTDCNSCHTREGANAAPGRILLEL